LVTSLVLLALVGCAPSPAWSAAAASLWVGDAPLDRIDEILPRQRKHSGTVSPTILNGSAIVPVSGICFDQSKDLWVSVRDALAEFTPAQLKQLKTTSNPTPAVTITSSSFSFLAGCTFDAQSNLWVADGDAEGVHEISKAQLDAGSADLTPAVTITSVATFAFAAFPAFDKSNNLWITSANNGKIVQFSASQLGSSGDKAPAIVLSNISDPGQPAFDRQGNMWVPSFFASTILKLKNADLAASGSPTPQVTLSAKMVMGVDSLAGPTALAFEGNGALWVANNTTGALAKFLPSKIKKSGSPVPKVLLKGIGGDTQEITFGPVF
jgi:ligand-binding sensor domain-containing protein